MSAAQARHEQVGKMRSLLDSIHNRIRVVKLRQNEANSKLGFSLRGGKFVINKTLMSEQRDGAQVRPLSGRRVDFSICARLLKSISQSSDSFACASSLSQTQRRLHPPLTACLTLSSARFVF